MLNIIKKTLILSRLIVILTCCYGSASHAETKINLNTKPLEIGGTIEVNSENLTIDSNAGTAIFSGNVEIVRGKITLKAQKIIVSYSIDKKSNQSLKEILAINDVVFIANDNLSQADKAKYNIENNTLELTGNVYVTQGSTKVSGNKVVINLNTGKGSISGRVKAILGSDEQ